MTRIAVEFMASTSSFLGGAPGTGDHKKGGERGGKAEFKSKTERERQTVRERGRKESKYAELVIFLSSLCFVMRSQKLSK